MIVGTRALDCVLECGSQSLFVQMCLLECVCWFVFGECACVGVDLLERVCQNEIVGVCVVGYVCQSVYVGVCLMDSVC